MLADGEFLCVQTSIIEFFYIELCLTLSSTNILNFQYLSVPLTSKTCVNYGSNLKATPNKSYMMASSAKAGFNPKQVNSSSHSAEK